MPEFTTVLGVDYKTIRELRYSHLTWRRSAPEIWRQPLVVFFDKTVLSPVDFGFLEHPQMRLAYWPVDDQITYASQREKMLTGFVHVPPRLVQTPWWLKLDTDAVRLDTSPWIDPAWFEPDAQRRYAAFIGNRWGYTKPADQMARLDDWGDGVADLAAHPRLDLPYEPGARRCGHVRLASWLTFFNTAWSREVATYCEPWRLPVPSEDGYHFYCAARRGDPYVLTKFKRKGWTNIPRLSNLISKVQEVLA